VIAPACLLAPKPLSGSRALTRPWTRSLRRNQWNGAINQDIIEGNMRGLADRSRLVGGKHTSLAELGYSDIGIDDGWQKCGSYGPEKYRYHSALGNPVLDERKWPRGMVHLTDLAHSLNLTAGWYGNACGCVDGCCSDHCDTLECFAGDINATLSFGFDSYKLDGCGAQRDIELWATMFNHSIEVRCGLAQHSRARSCFPSHRCPHPAH
jgi:alpha-galactosidase